VDAFLATVEATFSGQQNTVALTAQDVHDVIFSVRFGGYDEWQVDKHLDRLERQLEELAESAVESAVPSPADHELTTRSLSAPASSRTGWKLREQPALAARPSARNGSTVGESVRGESVRNDSVSGESVRSDSVRKGDGSVVAERRRSGGLAVTSYPGSASLDELAARVSRHGKADMTMEIPRYRPESFYQPADAQRLAELRATFKARRFGSGYEQGEVDRLFDGIEAVITGRSGGVIEESELDSSRFSFVQAGYYEDEVDRALREVRELIRGKNTDSR
jgi:DivIVA domain-containing protein